MPQLFLFMNVRVKGKNENDLVSFNVNVLVSFYNNRLDDIAFCILGVSELYAPCQFKN